MHIVTWKYDVMEGKNRQDLLYTVNASASDYLNVPGLIRKYYGISPDCRSVVEFYLWKSKADADKFFNLEWDSKTSQRWESALMTRQDFEAPVVVDCEKNKLITEP
jgi:hypothetical protein